MPYEHTQSQPAIAMVLWAGAVGLAVVALATGEPGPVFGTAFLGVVGLFAYAMSSLRTTVTADEIEVAFRFGRPRKVVPTADVLRSEVVRNRWWYGWGIRWIPGGTLWNVWGLDAVHLDRAGSRSFRIGTDDPEGLEAAIGANRPDPGVDGCWGT